MATTTTGTTPARRRHNNVKENVYFEPGKQGRRTGITLKDSGVRDEYGLEPVSGIFSSPEPSPQRNAPVPEPTEALDLRKTPHLPPRTQTPRHTNIGGSPVRHSSIKPDSRHVSPSRPLSTQPSDRANRLLDFNNAKSPSRTSYERLSPSPFKPRPAKSAKLQKTRKSIFTFDDEPSKALDTVVDESADLERTIQEAHDTLHEMVGSPAPDTTYSAPSTARAAHTTSRPESDASLTLLQTQSHLHRDSLRESPASTLPPMDAQIAASPSISATSNQKRKREQPRLGQVDDESVLKDHAVTSSKRPRSTSNDGKPDDQPLLEPTVDEHPVLDTTEYTAAEFTMPDVAMTNETTTDIATNLNHTSTSSSRPRKSFPIYNDNDEDDAADAGAQNDFDVDSAEEFVPPADLDHEQDHEHDQEPSPPKKRGRKPASKQKARKSPQGRAKKLSGMPSPEGDAAESEAGTKRSGPKSIVQLRAGTPGEEKDATMTRSGRTSIKPLKYWCNESFIWRHGEVEGVVRAAEVNNGKQTVKRTKTRKKAAMGTIKEDDDEEDEDLLPEAWEEELGVINGLVRTWDYEAGAGNPDDEVHEDIAFASTAIPTHDVQGSDFRYAKILTMPFFGAGMVEIPPEGYKRAKNSRKMQMVFFVHEGKVTVEVADIKFGMSKGGVWQVPRGNNYAIYNESKRHPAKIFFSQGCEVENGIDEAGPV